MDQDTKALVNNELNTDISQEEVEGANMDQDTKTLVDDELDVDSITTMEFEELLIVPELFYAFYKQGNKEVRPRKREYLFSYINSLGQYIRVQYLYPRATGEGFIYPYEGCLAFLGSTMHFLSYIARQHDLSL